MSSVRVLPGLTIAASICAASCSLVVQFHDQPGGADAGEDAGGPDDTGAPPEDGSMMDEPDVTVVDSAPGMKEAGVKPDHYAPCLGLVNGYYCANDGPTAFAGPSSDLLFCDEGGIGQAFTCDGGCLDLPSPFPDACNPCVGVADGLYCGRDLAGFPAYNADFLIQCQTGNTVQQVACAHGCDSNGKMSACAMP
jgi:hypothetical protein